MTVKEANFKIGDRFRYPETHTVWEVDSIVERGVIAKAAGFRSPKGDAWAISPGSHKHFAFWDQPIYKI